MLKRLLSKKQNRPLVTSRQIFLPGYELTRGRCTTSQRRHISKYSCPASSLDEAVVDAPSATSNTLGLTNVLSTGARLTSAAQAAWAQVLRPGDTAVDATCGNGHDTLFLAQTVGPNGKVYGFDIQDTAITATRARLEAALPPTSHPATTLTATCHSRLQEVCGSGVARVVAFNLGYLPGAADKRLTTATATTVAALEAALEVVAPGGLVSVLAYVGHPGGQQEYEAVRELLGGLSPSYWVSTETRLLNRPTAPILLLLWRRDDSLPGRK